jgi:hypothetical protein
MQRQTGGHHAGGVRVLRAVFQKPPIFAPAAGALLCLYEVRSAVLDCDGT